VNIEMQITQQPTVRTLTLTDDSQWVLHDAWLAFKSSGEIIGRLSAIRAAVQSAMASGSESAPETLALRG
jgi:hypothetical protein